MDGRNKFLLLTGLIWSEVMVFIALTQEKNKEFWQTLLISAVPALITGLITMAVSRKSQLKKENLKLKQENEKLLNENQKLKRQIDIDGIEARKIGR